MVSIALLFLLGVFIDDRVPRSPYVAGEYRDGIFHDLISVDLTYHVKDSETTASIDGIDQVFLQATVHHELVHSFRSRGIIDIDVPIAAAWGYYFEWSKKEDLTDKSKVKYIEEGMDSIDPGAHIEEIVGKYRAEFVEETPESYVDAAKFAGALYALFNTDDDMAMFYVLATGMRLDHQSAMYAASNPMAIGAILSFRWGSYFEFNQSKFDSDMLKLSKDTRDVVMTYINSLSETHEVGLVPRIDGIIDFSEGSSMDLRPTD